MYLGLQPDRGPALLGQRDLILKGTNEVYSIDIEVWQIGSGLSNHTVSGLFGKFK